MKKIKQKTKRKIVLAVCVLAAALVIVLIVQGVRGLFYKKADTSAGLEYIHGEEKGDIAAIEKKIELLEKKDGEEGAGERSLKEKFTGAVIVAAVCELEQSDYEQLYQEEMNRSGMTHGEYNYHNIIMTREGIATMNFEKFHRDIQVEDLYYFLRKVMEKSGWKLRLGDGMLNAYSAIHPLTRSETEYLKIRLIYPEKFWKIANSYYCMNKAWISVKNTEKLKTAIKQTEEKKMFLKELFGFEL